MSINFDVVIETADYSADMSAGLETIQGACEATRLISHTLLLNRVPGNLQKGSKVRNRMKKTFKGSYGMEFCIESDDPDVKKKLASIGHAAFTELMSYFINEALFLESKKLSNKAEKILDELGEDTTHKLIDKLQKSPLNNLHSYSNHFGNGVKLRYRKNKTTQTTLANFDRMSFLSLVPKQDDNKVIINASITRFNINTGNGRLLIDGEEETVAFGFTSKYKEIRHQAKKMFTQNLDQCNGVSNEKWGKLTLECTTLRNRNGAVVKYLIQGVG